MGRHRNDTKHLPVDVLMFAAKGLVVGAGLFAVGKALVNVVSPPRKGIFALLS